MISVVRAFRLLRKQSFFLAIDQKEYIVWCDVGKHFRNCGLIGYLFNDLALEKIHGFNIYLKKYC